MDEKIPNFEPRPVSASSGLNRRRRSTIFRVTIRFQPIKDAGTNPRHERAFESTGLFPQRRVGAQSEVRPLLISASAFMPFLSRSIYSLPFATHTCRCGRDLEVDTDERVQSASLIQHSHEQRPSLWENAENYRPLSKLQLR